MDGLDSSVCTEPCFCTAVRQAARRLSQFYDAALAPVELSVNQYAVLARIERSGPGTIGDLAAGLVMDRSTLGHLLRPLDARRLVVLAPARDDRRRRLLTLTPAGSALLAAARPLWVEAQHRFIEAYGREAANQLHDMLGEVATLAFAEPAKAAVRRPPAAA